MTIQYEKILKPDAEQVEPLRNALKAFNEAQLGDYSAEPILVKAGTNNGQICGAVHGWLQFGWLYVNMLWVDESFRRRGIGTVLLQEIEEYATSRRIFRSRLATSDFQPGYALYRQCGYEVYATIPIMPASDGTDAHVEYLMWKHWLADVPAAVKSAL
ncbi:GNAT family N-acetyltransferase [Rugamonas apoptosis]|uniref:GNAT family N-acetyltransferase n=1 Tax=Rugamonas apoptosis TaxID=2758570 RepID=A0A7W2IJT6_9BURK|nr:GNAT family N-acetyltransferase [Rugamonas apoptosis]MBA5686687.1 GNAT family N-acetyltransferase [Rugamonas apoptosis]